MFIVAHKNNPLRTQESQLVSSVSDKIWSTLNFFRKHGVVAIILCHYLQCGLLCCRFLSMILCKTLQCLPYDRIWPREEINYPGHSIGSSMPDQLGNVYWPTNKFTADSSLTLSLIYPYLKGWWKNRCRYFALIMYHGSTWHMSDHSSIKFGYTGNAHFNIYNIISLKPDYIQFLHQFLKPNYIQ